jgi:hypothetical protein
VEAAVARNGNRFASFAKSLRGKGPAERIGVSLRQRLADRSFSSTA